MFKFLKRQLKTKTGKWALGIIGASVLDGVSRQTIGVGVHEIPLAGVIVDKILGPEVSAVMMGFSFQRDKEAKKENGEI